MISRRTDVTTQAWYTNGLGQMQEYWFQSEHTSSKIGTLFHRLIKTERNANIVLIVLCGKESMTSVH